MITPFGNSRARVLATEDGTAVGAANALPVSVASGSGGVTEYTEDAASAANPIGAALILRRRDTPTVSEVTTDGDNVAANATAKGEIRVADTCGVATKSTVASGTSSVAILALNLNRKGATVANTDANALYLDVSGGTASSTSFTVTIAANGYYEVPFGYTGAMTGIWAGDGSGSALVTEFV